MFVSNQARLRRYRKDRFIEEQNDNAQQMELYASLAAQRGDEEQAEALSRLAARTFSKLATSETPVVEKAAVPQLSGFDILKNAVKNGKLDELFKSVIKLPDSVLSPAQKLIKKDLKNAEFKKTLNETVADAIDQKLKSDDISKVLREAIGGDDFQSDLDKMFEKAETGSEYSNASNAPTLASLASQASTLATSLKTEHAETGKQLDSGELDRLIKTQLSGEGSVTKLKAYLETLGLESSYLSSNGQKAKKDFGDIFRKSEYYLEGIAE